MDSRPVALKWFALSNKQSLSAELLHCERVPARVSMCSPHMSSGGMLGELKWSFRGGLAL